MCGMQRHVEAIAWTIEANRESPTIPATEGGNLLRFESHLLILYDIRDKLHGLK